MSEPDQISKRMGAMTAYLVFVIIMSALVIIGFGFLMRLWEWAFGG